MILVVLGTVFHGVYLFNNSKASYICPRRSWRSAGKWEVTAKWGYFPLGQNPTTTLNEADVRIARERLGVGERRVCEESREPETENESSEISRARFRGSTWIGEYAIEGAGHDRRDPWLSALINGSRY